MSIVKFEFVAITSKTNSPTELYVFKIPFWKDCDDDCDDVEKLKFIEFFAGFGNTEMVCFSTSMVLIANPPVSDLYIARGLDRYSPRYNTAREHLTKTKKYYAESNKNIILSLFNFLDFIINKILVKSDLFGALT